MGGFRRCSAKAAERKVNSGGGDCGLLITGAVIFFFVVKPVNALFALANRKAEEKPAEPAPIPEDVKLLMEIRDLLKARSQ
jgi:large conductance mechanosensitive channel